MPAVPPAPKVEAPVVTPMPFAPKIETPPAPPSVTPVPMPPSVLPIPDTTPKPVVEPPAPGTLPPMSFVKPTGNTEAKPEVKPEVPVTLPKTNFDVDLHNPTAGDTYESISQEFYNDRRFAAALKAFNRNLPLQGGRYVEVPPLHILKRKFPTQTSNTVSVGSSGLPPAATQTWSAPTNPTEPTPPRATGNDRGTFIVPQGGMTLQDVAKQVGSHWRDLYDLNRQYTPDVRIPAGTELKLPASARP
jgi:hypothetical protein